MKITIQDAGHGKGYLVLPPEVLKEVDFQVWETVVVDVGWAGGLIVTKLDERKGRV